MLPNPKMDDYDTTHDFSINHILDDPFVDLDPTELSKTQDTDMILAQIIFITAEILKLVICVISSGATCFLIYALLKFSKLRKYSGFLLHYNISVLIDILILPPINFITQFVVDYHSWDTICVVYSIGDSSYILVLIFGSGIGAFWWIKVFKRSWIERFPALQTCIIILCYLTSVAKMSVDVFECFLEHSLHASNIVIGIYLVLIIWQMFVNVSARKADATANQTRYLLTVSNIIIFSYLPLLAVTAVFNNVDYFEMSLVIELFIYIMHALALSGPVVVVYLLGERSKHFKAAYSAVLKKSVRDYSEEEMIDDLDDEGTNAVPNNSIV